MGNLGLTDWLTLAQTVGIVASLALTLYFAIRQTRTMTADVESRVLNDLDEKRYRISELLVQNPSLIGGIGGPTAGSRPEHVVSYMVALVSSHAFHMHQRRIISDNEWIGWEQWIKNDFVLGATGKDWVELNMGRWFDPSFRQYVERDILPPSRAQS